MSPLKPPIAILKTGETFRHLARELDDFEQWTWFGTGLPPDRVQAVAVHEGESLPELHEISAAIITGSHAMVTERQPWMLATAGWLQQAVASDLPLLGICFGHQLLVEALGGKVDWNPKGREIGTVSIQLTEAGKQDSLLGTLPADFPAHVTHSQSATRLPPGALRLASSDGDPHQAFRCGSAWGVQFHPEFSEQAMRGYIDTLAEDLRAEGLDPEALRQEARATPEATSLLARFAGMARHRT